MLNLFENYSKPIKVNGKIYPDGKVAYAAHLKWTGDVKIELNWEQEQTPVQPVKTPVSSPQTPQTVNNTEYIITVRQYMTKPSTPQFDFHDKWNNGNPMPLRTMVGTKLEETRGMVRMELRGMAMPTGTCIKCGRKLTHPVSLNYGIGPECGGHYHIGPEMPLEEIAKRMRQITWTGWIVKSAITEEKIFSRGEVA